MCPKNDIKQSDVEAPIMLELWGMQSEKKAMEKKKVGTILINSSTNSNLKQDTCKGLKNVYRQNVFSIFNQTHTHTHTHIYIYIYIYSVSLFYGIVDG